MDITQRTIRRIFRRCGTTDPFKICKAYHIIVVFCHLTSSYGFHFYGIHHDMIFISEDLDEDWQRFTCAHELGHVFFHRDINTHWVKRYTGFSVDKIECQADDFAARLLSYGIEPEEGMTFQQYAALCGIPPERAKGLLKE